MAGRFDVGQVSGYHGQYHQPEAIALTPLSGGQILIALAVIAVVGIVLWIPVLWDYLTAFMSTNMPKWGPRIFVVGLALLIIGLMTGVHILAFVGGGAIGALVAGLVYDNY